MSELFAFTKEQLNLADAIISLCEDARNDRPIDSGMLAALKINLNWRGLFDQHGEPVCDLFSEPLRELLDASDDLLRWGEEF